LTLEDGFIRLASHPLPLAAVVEMKGKLIGVVGGMVAMVTPSMKTQGLSAYHWDNPLAVLQTVGEWLRPQVDWLFALTHIGLGEDRNLAEATAVFDGIFSGHSHDVLFEPEWVGSSPILQGGSHGRYFSVSTWTKVRGLIDYSLVPWKTTHS
jgi:2',3'-cyclic-nucleotide 2'-phosphodiesterase (5'-nucleotidase family)